MGNMVLDFLGNQVLPTVGAVGGGLAGAALGELVDPLGGGIVGGIAGAAGGSALGKAAGNAITGQQLGSGVVPAAIGGAVGQGIGGLAAGAIGDTLGSGIAGAAAKGAVVGGTSSAGTAAVMGERDPKNLALDFLQGGVFGGATGAASAGVSRALSARTAASVAKSDNPAEIEKQIAPEVGPTVAQDTAQALAQTHDPNIVQRIVENDIQAKTSPATRPNTEMQPQIEQTPAPQGPQPAMSPEEAQSLQQQYEGLTPKERGADGPFLNAPGEAQGTSHVSQLGGMTQLSEDLSNGVPVAEAVSKYMDTTGAGPEEARKAYLDIVGNGAVDKGKINSTLNPENERVSRMLPDAQPGDIERPTLNTQVVHNELTRLAQHAMETGNQLDQHDIDLMGTLHGKTLEQLLPEAHDKDAFTAAFNALKQYDDTTQALGARELGVEVPYRQNHGLTMRWANSDAELKAAQQRIATNSRNPGYTGPRTIQSYEVGKQFGLTPKNENIYQDLQDDLEQKQTVLGRLAYQKGLEQAFPGKVKSGVLPVDAQGTWKQLITPYGNRLFMPADIANQINERSPAPESTGFWKGYDALNGNWKNLKLAGGGFHAVNTMGNWFAQQLASGNLFKHPEDSVGVLRSLFDPKFVADTVQQWDSSGASLHEDQAGLNANLHATQADIAPSGKLGNLPVLKQMHEAIFGRQIPFMMKAEFHQATEGLDFTDPDQLAQATKIAKSINQRYGSFNRAIQGLTPSQAKLLGRGILATGWNEGQIRTLVDAFSKGGIEGKMARQTVFGKALLFGALATLGGAAGGEFKDQDPKQIAFNILQKTINPSFQFGNYTVGLPTTQLSEVGKPLSEAVGNAVQGKNPMTPFQDFASARLAAIPSAAEQVVSNRTFSGQNIVGNDYYGRPISPVQSAMNILQGVAPIPVAQGTQTIAGQQNIGAAIANTVGLSTHPTYDLNYAPVAGQTYVQALQQVGAPQKQVQAATGFFGIIGSLGKAHTNAMKQVEGDIAKGDHAKAQADAQSYNQQLAQKLAPWLQSDNAKYLDPTMLQILHSSVINTGSAAKYARSDVKKNPTAFGQPLSASTYFSQAQTNKR